MIPPGTMLQARYRVERALTDKSLGHSFLATDISLRREVVLKPVAEPPDLKLLTDLRHPALPAVWGGFEEGEIWWVVGELVRGESLAERAGPFSLEQVLGWADELVAVLGYLHGRGLTAGNLRPETVVLDAGRLRLTDFGLAGLRPPPDNQYVPLEQNVRGTTNVATDMYSLGALLFTLLAGEPPPEAEARARGEATLPSLRGVPRTVQTALESMLSLAPTERPDSMMYAGLALGVVAPETPEPEPQPPRPLSAGGKLIAAGLGLVVALGILFFSLLQAGGLPGTRSPQPRPRPAQVAQPPRPRPVRTPVAAPTPTPTPAETATPTETPTPAQTPTPGETPRAAATPEPAFAWETATPTPTPSAAPVAGAADPVEAVRTYYNLIAADKFDEAYALRSQRSHAQTGRPAFESAWDNNRGIKVESARVAEVDGERCRVEARIVFDDVQSNGQQAAVTYDCSINLVLEGGAWRYDGGDFTPR